MILLNHNRTNFTGQKHRDGLDFASNYKVVRSFLKAAAHYRTCLISKYKQSSFVIRKPKVVSTVQATQ